MTGNPPSARALVLAGLVCGLSILGVSGFVRAQTTATQAPARAGDRRFTFDIPAQPLDMALELFSTVSGRSALFSSALVAGRTASPVSGQYTALEALRRLLEGTGLAVETASTSGVSTFVLVPVAPDAAPPAPGEVDAAAQFAGYDALVQTEVWQAICANARTSATRYRALLRFRVAADGRVLDVRVLSETSETPMARALVDTLSQVRVSQPPLPGMPQPFAMLILPASRGGPACHGARAS
ncbi:STN domain-containing protein [Pandoraea pulmonicola]|uniref:Outer membrane receptor for ferric coprogen and ferric-rhodotorulic acid n=1 Tax=Pandoraea pulmonicola TaxID=93221 RepID=A0AAJ4ZA17_PANPU|nr:STN domain-containing protein [Pandoraea pulmonicola]APD13382.1 hypothetical protein RO07_15920 [Pandoraea pulmonicola]SUA89575.1 Outer membrane receptor for ferric coprogen and ferric-rhodotorulic acid [Pandoraea pulmonicola]